MTTTTQKLTFEQYLAYDDGTDTRYELVNGELVPMAMGSGLHGEIMHLLETQFIVEIERMNRNWIARKALIGVRSPRAGRWDTSRIPDVTVIPADQWQALRQREAVIELNEPPPLLVVEVISESTKSVDYRTKRSEYAVLNIQEYWIVDPLEQVVTLCNLVEGFYDASEYREGDRVLSPTFPELALTAEQIFAAERQRL
jgi:Uma2 family endonuclease